MTEQFYIDTIIAEYRRMGRLRRWLFWRRCPFIEIAVRHLSEGTP